LWLVACEREKKRGLEGSIDASCFALVLTRVCSFNKGITKGDGERQIELDRTFAIDVVIRVIITHASPPRQRVISARSASNTIVPSVIGTNR
jgi:hypothetical protein